MSFRPTKYDSGKVEYLPLGTAAVAVKHAHMKMSSGYLVAGAAGDNEAEYIALETATGGATDGSVYCNVIRIDDVTEFEASTATTPVQATHVGNDYDFASSTALDLTATTDKVFHIDRIVSAADKLVSGHFNKPALA